MLNFRTVRKKLQENGFMVSGAAEFLKKDGANTNPKLQLISLTA